MLLPSFISQTLNVINVYGVFASTTMYPINNPNVGKSTTHGVFRYELSTENKRISIHMLLTNSMIYQKTHAVFFPRWTRVKRNWIGRL